MHETTAVDSEDSSDDGVAVCHDRDDVPHSAAELSAKAASPKPNTGGDKPHKKGRVLVVDDDPDMCELLTSALERHGFGVVSTESPEHALELAMENNVDVVLSDLGMDGMNGIELCQRIHATSPDLPVALITGQGSMSSVIAALRAGVHDFFTKPVEMELLAIRVERAIRHRRLGTELNELRGAIKRSRGPENIIGASPPMQRVFDLIGRVAPTEASVVVMGESGTGKELVARAIHEQSERKDGPFVAINCAAVPPTLIESELFGHVKGAFTDARADRLGLFQEANGGTLFLDEIGELSPEIQPKLLRALQERKVRPVGGRSEVSFDARIVTATNRDLESEVDEGRFRSDLYYRLNVVRMNLPPLRERGNDVLLLAQYFLEQSNERHHRSIEALPQDVATKLLDYSWPGNVRELQNCMERAVALCLGTSLTLEDLPDRIRAYQADRFVVAADDTQELLPLADLERRYIERVLKLVNNNKSRAASILGLDRRTLYRKLERYQKQDAKALKERPA